MPKTHRFIETEIGGVLRSIDFIYKEAGVNRPLKPADIRGQNLNQTDYANQLNKVANAVKFILSALRNQTAKPPEKVVAASGQPRPQSKMRAVVLSLIILALAIAGFLVFLTWTSNQPPAEVLDKSIAVLPFADMSPQKDQEYLGDGIAEEILNVLARVKDLKVIGRTSSFSYKGKGTNLKTIGEELGVSTILEGSIRKDGNKVRITAQFIKASDGSHLWSESYDRELKDIFQIQDELAKNISRSLLSTFEDPAAASNVREGPTNNEAYDLYLLGKYQFSQKFETPNSLKTKFHESIRSYKKSLKLDSLFANTYAELAQSYTFYGFFFGNQEIRNVYDSAELYARKALALDKRNVQAYIDLALIKRNRDWDWEGSRQYFQRAKSIAPNHSYTLGLYAMLLSALNQTDSALYYARKGVVLDPNSENARFYELRAFYYDRQFHKAASLISGVDQITRRDLIIMALSPNKDVIAPMLIKFADLDINIKQELDNYYHANGWDALMKKLYTSYLDKLNTGEIMVKIYAAPRDVLFGELSRDVDNQVGNMVYLLIDPVYDPIRSDPRYDQLLKRMGLDKYK